MIRRYIIKVPGALLLSVMILIRAGTMNGSAGGNLFGSEEILNLELRADFSSILKGRDKYPVDHPGVLIFNTEDGKIKKLNVIVTARGNYRMKPENCDFPPLSVNFKKSDAENTIFEGQKKLKLVTPCREEPDLLEEYIVYRMYNRITDFSLRVRLANILYFDTGENKIMFRKHSFFIENADEAAERNNCTENNNFLTPFDIDSDSYKKLSFFQYMIGNRDWFVVSRKNIEILQPRDTTLPPVAVPYDFDFSGFVDASYTKPADVPEYMLKDRRVFKGICYTYEELKEIFDYYRDIKPNLEEIIKNQKLLTISERSFLISYIRRFYNIIDNEKLVRENFIDVCEKREDYNMIDKQKQGL